MWFRGRKKQTRDITIEEKTTPETSYLRVCLSFVPINPTPTSAPRTLKNVKCLHSPQLLNAFVSGNLYNHVY